LAEFDSNHLVPLRQKPGDIAGLATERHKDAGIGRKVKGRKMRNQQRICFGCMKPDLARLPTLQPEFRIHPTALCPIVSPRLRPDLPEGKSKAKVDSKRQRVLGLCESITSIAGVLLASFIQGLNSEAKSRLSHPIPVGFSVRLRGILGKGQHLRLSDRQNHSEILTNRLGLS
jgi:hypothetical protein